MRIDLGCNILDLLPRNVPEKFRTFFARHYRLSRAVAAPNKPVMAGKKRPDLFWGVSRENRENLQEYYTPE